MLPQPRSPGVALLVYGSREVLSRHALATDGSMMAPQTIRPQVALVAFSPDLRVCAAARCIRSAHALANLLRRSLRFARASERRLPFQLAPRSEKNVVYVTVRRFPALPVAIRHPAQPRRCTWLTLSRVTHQRARQPHPVCCSSQSSGPDVNAVILAAAVGTRVLLCRVDLHIGRTHHMVLSAAV